MTIIQSKSSLYVHSQASNFVHRCFHPLPWPFFNLLLLAHVYMFYAGEWLHCCVPILQRMIYLDSLSNSMIQWVQFSRSNNAVVHQFTSAGEGSNLQTFTKYFPTNTKT
jgi:hypothetical protein